MDRVTAPDFLLDLEQTELTVVRDKRRECQDLENGLSYVRRLLHGRLDIVRGELERRRAGAEPAALDDLIARLPEVLSDGSRSDSLPRPPQDLAPDSHAERLVGDLDARFPASALGELPERSDADLADLVEQLAGYEREISGDRAALHDVIDRLHGEIVRRYRAGEASVDSLLP